MLYDNDFALKAGFDLAGTMHDKKDYASILRAVLAYSAIDAGTTLFGNTGIRALYDDANAFGAARMAESNPFNPLHMYVPDIDKVFVHYAGLLALKKIESAAFADATKGVVGYDATKKLLTLNFDEALWTKANGGTLPTMAANDNQQMIKQKVA